MTTRVSLILLSSWTLQTLQRWQICLQSFWRKPWGNLLTRRQFDEGDRNANFWISHFIMGWLLLAPWWWPLGEDLSFNDSIMHDSLPSWHRLVEEWMGCSSHTTMLILSPILSSTGRWTLAWSTIASKSIHYINSKRGSAIPCCNNWRAILFAHWYKLVQQFFSKKTFGGIFYHFERSELYQTSFLDDHIFPRGSL